MMLVHDEIEWFLSAAPTPGFGHRGPDPSTAHNLYAVDDLLGFAISKLVGKPKDLMTSPGQSGEIAQSHAFGPACQRIPGVTPIQHQESHLSALICHSRYVFGACILKTFSLRYAKCIPLARNVAYSRCKRLVKTRHDHS